MYTKRTGIKCLLATLGLLGVAIAGNAQSENSRVFTGAWPLQDVAQQLISQYAKPVTFEAPLEMWRSEKQLFGLYHGTEVLAPQPHSILLPASAGIFDAPSLSIDQIKKVLEIYHQQNPNRSRYTVIQSTLGFHIVPTHARDAEGVLREVKSVLDTPVEILQAKRTASEHVQALLDTLAQLTGIPFTWGSPDIDGFYAANGYTLPGAVESEDRPYMLFEWGAHGTNARDALIDLLKNSATTLTWTLNCGPDFQRGNQPICNFGLGPLIVEGRVVSLDRCTRCKVLPRQEARTAK